MLDTILQAIKILEKKPRTKREQEVYDFLINTSTREIRKNMFHLLNYSDVLGWDKIEGVADDVKKLVKLTKQQSKKK